MRLKHILSDIKEEWVGGRERGRKMNIYYHGTDKKSAKSIIKEGFDLNKMAFTHFGEGVYVCEDKQDAFEWGEVVLRIKIDTRSHHQFFVGNNEDYFTELRRNGIEPYIEPKKTRDWMLKNNYKIAFTTEDWDESGKERDIAIIFDLDCIEEIEVVENI